MRTARAAMWMRASGRASGLPDRLLAREQGHVVGDRLGRSPVAGEADPLEAALVHQGEARLVLLTDRLGLDGEALPDRLQLSARAEHEVEPPDHALGGEEFAGPLGVVARR